MTRIAWNTRGERFFETGSDRGVLYLPGQSGVAWNGLKKVSESPDGGTPTPYYVDGYKYINVASAEEFKATLSAYSSPQEFAVCDGTLSIHNGLFATQQPRKPFNLSYRTLIGNDISGADHGYKIHLVYNALAAPATRENATLTNSPTALDLSWSITTTPPKITGLRPTAHFVVDSRLTPPNLLAALEDILYGTMDTEARIPEVSEIIDLFNSNGPILRRNNLKIPRPNTLVGIDWTGSSGTDIIPEPGYFGGALSFTTIPIIVTGASDKGFAAGEKVTLMIHYRVTALSTGTGTICVMPYGISGVYYRNGYQVARHAVAGRDEYVTINWIAPTDILPNNLAILVCGSNPTGADFVSAGAGFGLRATEALIESGWDKGPFFDGNIPNTELITYEWEGAPNLSPSVMRSWY